MRLARMTIYRHTVTDTVSGEVVGTIESDEVVIQAPAGTTVETEDVTQEVTDRAAAKQTAIDAQVATDATTKTNRYAVIQRLKDADVSGESQLIQDLVALLREVS